jgi:DNA-directed RNA polymerase subunit M/transcription elongation factor TFIIS
MIQKIENPDTFRANVVNKLNVYFNNIKHSSNLEKGIHNWSIKEANNKKIIKKWDNPYFIQIYLDHLRSIYINLKNNKSLVENVISGEIKAHSIAFMTHQELYPEKWDELIKAKSIRDKNKFEVNIEASTDAFTCRKCKSKKITYVQAQIRAADEGCTTFYTCLSCGARWKTN